MDKEGLNPIPAGRLYPIKAAQSLQEPGNTSEIYGLDPVRDSDQRRG